MLADDIFRRELAAVTSELLTWAPTQRSVARVEIREGHGYWSLSAHPLTPGACPVTLVLRFDQYFDLALDGDRFENRPVENYRLFPPMLAAIAAGKVERRHFVSAETGALAAQDMRIHLPDRIFTFERPSTARTAPTSNHASSELVCKTQMYLPYAR